MLRVVWCPKSHMWWWVWQIGSVGSGVGTGVGAGVVGVLVGVLVGAGVVGVLVGEGVGSGVGSGVGVLVVGVAVGAPVVGVIVGVNVVGASEGITLFFVILGVQVGFHPFTVTPMQRELQKLAHIMLSRSMCSQIFSTISGKASHRHSGSMSSDIPSLLFLIDSSYISWMVRRYPLQSSCCQCLQTSVGAAVGLPVTVSSGTVPVPVMGDSDSSITTSEVSTITTSGAAAGPKIVACASFISSAEVARLITAAKFFHFAEVDWISSGASSPVASGTT